MFDLKKIFDLRKIFAVPKDFLKSKIYFTVYQCIQKSPTFGTTAIKSG